MLELCNVSKSYKNEEVLKKINLKFPSKGLFCILGKSGSGKTTLLNLMGGIDHPTEGNIYFNKEDISKIKKEKYLSSYVSFVFQSYNLIENITVSENLKLINNKLENILKDLNIEKLKNKKVKFLSGGEKQRVAIARALLQDNQVLLTDEPTGALDTKQSENIMRILKEISKTKLVIMITHNVDLAKKYADKIINIEDGQIKYQINFNDNINAPITKKKIKLKFFQIIKLAINNFFENKLRNALTILAFTIGLTSLSLVMCLNKGFKTELVKLEQETLYNYPIVLSKEKLILNFNSENNDNNEIKVNKDYTIIKNDLSKKTVEKINKLENADISYNYKINSNYQDLFYSIPNLNFFNIVKGNLPKESNELLLLLNEEGAISESLKTYLNLSELKYNEVLNKKIIINNKSYFFVGIVKSKNSFFSSTSGILYLDKAFNTKLTEILIFPRNYNAKEKIKKELKDYNLIDDAKEVLNITNTLINSISTILIIFSITSLIVAIILISTITHISILEKIKDIGILKCLGIKNKQIKKIYFYENVIISVLSTFLTLIFTSSIAKYLNIFLSKKTSFNNLLSVSLSTGLFVLIISIIITKLATIIPTYIATKKKIVDILHNS